MPRTTRCESSTWRELPASRAPALSASRSGRASLYELMNSGEIPWMRLGGVRRLPVEALRQLTGESHPRVPQMEPLFYRPAEAAAALRVSRSKVYELMKRARSPGCGWEGSAACPWRHFGNSYGRGSLIDGTRLPVGTAGPTGDRCPNAGSRLRRCVLAAAHTTSQATSRWCGRAHAARHTLPRRSAGTRDAVRSEVGRSFGEVLGGVPGGRFAPCPITRHRARRAHHGEATTGGDRTMSTRRGRGEGSITRRADGRWMARVDLGWQDGKRRRKTPSSLHTTSPPGCGAIRRMGRVLGRRGTRGQCCAPH